MYYFIVPCDIAGEIEVRVKKKKFVQSKSCTGHAKKLNNEETEDFKWIKKGPLNRTQPKIEEKCKIGTLKKYFDIFFSSEVFFFFFTSC